MNLPSVLVTEDDIALGMLLETTLAAHGYRVTVVRTGRAALEAATTDPPDVVLLDIGLPDLRGTEVCRHLRRSFDNPIIMLTAEADEATKVGALDAGADDYVTKPFSMPELLARLRVALRLRRVIAEAVDPICLGIGDLTIDTAAHLAYTPDGALALAPTEYALLALLARNVGRYVPTETISRALGHPTLTLGALRVHMTKLRAKLGAGPDRPVVETAPGVGYRLVVVA